MAFYRDLIREFVASRIHQPSTWAGLIALGASAAGLVIDDATVHTLDDAAVAIVGILAVPHNG